MQLCGFRFSIYYFNSMKTSISIEKDDIFVIEVMVRVWCLAFSANLVVCIGWNNVYSRQHYVIKFVSDLWQAGGFLWILRLPPSIKLTATSYNWNIVESGIKHHQTFWINFKSFDLWELLSYWAETNIYIRT
jgi:hypothetical protein